jgi:hypothetical protein
MRSFGNILSRSEERQNLRSGGLVIATLCVLIGLIFAVMNLEFDRRSSEVDSDSASQTALTDD